ncbi:MAG: MBOAT family protein [Holosporaceae bacterium]|nr:MBOAT family protein [Holosporaceae bacterium]
MSLIFYAHWNPTYLYILMTSVVLNYLIARMFNSDTKSESIRKFFLTIGITANIVALGYYKYMDFFIDNLNGLFGTNMPLQHVVLPLAISFFTFQQIAYLVDNYQRKAKEDDFVNYMLFVTFFPQLIAGPIVHHAEIMPQFDVVRNKVINYKNLSTGLVLFTIGLFKKTVLADIFSEYVKYGFDESASLSTLEAWMISFSYTFQIYFDFSGYSDMAVGIGKMFNFALPLNFNSPYKAVSIQDFWRRWHMTLTRFFRDYVYIPLGGNRGGSLKTYHNLWITFLLTGIWHGASWMFVLWGAIHGVALTVCRLSKTYFRRGVARINRKVSILITFLFVNLAWVFFRAENWKQAKKILVAMFGKTQCLLPRFFHLDIKFTIAGHIYDYMLPFLIIGFGLVFMSKNSNELISKFEITSKKQLMKSLAIILTLFMAALYKIIFVPYTEFIYFNF